MRAQTLPSAAGWRWLASGFLIYRRNPPMMSMLVLAYWLTVVFLNLFPVIGALAAAVAVPGLSVGLMQAARNLERGLPVNLATLFGSFRESARTLMALGALYLLCSLGALAASALIDGGDLFHFMLAGSRSERALVEDADFTGSALLVMLLMVPVLMAWWFAPVLAAWHRLSLGRSLFFSFVACWMNWRPFLNYSVALLVLSVLLPGVLVALVLVVLPGLSEFMFAIIMVPMILVAAPVIFASFYACYRDIFGISEIV